MSRRVVFVCRSAAGESLRSAQALRNLERVELFGIVEDSSGADVFVDAQQVANVHDADQLIAAARVLGPLDHIVTAQETLLPLARRAVMTPSWGRRSGLCVMSATIPILMMLTGTARPSWVFGCGQPPRRSKRVPGRIRCF